MWDVEEWFDEEPGDGSIGAEDLLIEGVEELRDEGENKAGEGEVPEG